MASPRRPGGTNRPAVSGMSTVMIAKPTPRSADTISTHQNACPIRYSGAGAPSMTRPKASTGISPNRLTIAGTSA